MCPVSSLSRGEIELAKPGIPPSKEEIDLGGRVLTLRKSNGWTLETLCEKSGVSRSALSKIEKDQVSPTFDVLLKISRGFGISVSDLIGARKESAPVGRRAVTRKGEARNTETDHYVIDSHAAELAQKLMLPFCVTVKAHDISEFEDWDRHISDDFIYVLSGTIEFHSEWYEPLVLGEGESLYIDSRMGHAFISKGDEDARILWINSG